MTNPLRVEDVAERLERRLPDLEAAALPTKCETFVVCGSNAGDLRDDLEQAATLLRRQAEALQAAESRATKAEGELERVKGALREIAALRMTREQFIGQGPAFACRQVERAVSIAEAALSPTPQGGEEPPTPTQEGA